MSSNSQIAVILFTLRDFCKNLEDIDATFARLKDIGYEAVQVSGIGEYNPKDIKPLLEKHGLTACATHDNWTNIFEQTDIVVDRLQVLNTDFTALGCPPHDYLNLEGQNKIISEFNRVGEILSDKGLKLGYHNHAFEFEKYGEKSFLETFYEETNPDYVYAELDVHWITRGGGDPIQWIKKVAGRMPVIHFKDFAVVKNEPTFCEVGEGNLNWPGILDACQEIGVKWYVVEQDSPFPGRDIWESVEISFNNLKKMGIQ
ncbi:MAG: sugar phosphate isomerase/epimerase [Lentisphaeria bacterium]|nr:sugar phosphate isomerase/epimerase [Lentisphaeria bacterium]